MCVLVSAWFSDSCEYVVFDEVDECVCYGCSVVVEASACQFGVDFVEVFCLVEPVFFPEFLDDASACFCSGRRCWAFGDLGEVGVF